MSGQTAKSPSLKGIVNQIDEVIAAVEVSGDFARILGLQIEGLLISVCFHAAVPSGLAKMAVVR